MAKSALLGVASVDDEEGSKGGNSGRQSSSLMPATIMNTGNTADLGVFTAVSQVLNVVAKSSTAAIGPNGLTALMGIAISLLLPGVVATFPATMAHLHNVRTAHDKKNRLFKAAIDISKILINVGVISLYLWGFITGVFGMALLPVAFAIPFAGLLATYTSIFIVLAIRKIYRAVKRLNLRHLKAHLDAKDDNDRRKSKNLEEQKAILAGYVGYYDKLNLSNAAFYAQQKKDYERYLALQPLKAQLKQLIAQNQAQPTLTRSQLIRKLEQRISKIEKEIGPVPYFDQAMALYEQQKNNLAAKIKFQAWVITLSLGFLITCVCLALNPWFGALSVVFAISATGNAIAGVGTVGLFYHIIGSRAGNLKAWWNDPSTTSDQRKIVVATIAGVALIILGFVVLNLFSFGAPIAIVGAIGAAIAIAGAVTLVCARYLEKRSNDAVKAAQQAIAEENTVQNQLTQSATETQQLLIDNTPEVILAVPEQTQEEERLHVSFAPTTADEPAPQNAKPAIPSKHRTSYRSAAHAQHVLFSSPHIMTDGKGVGPGPDIEENRSHVL